MVETPPRPYPPNNICATTNIPADPSLHSPLPGHFPAPTRLANLGSRCCKGREAPERKGKGEKKSGVRVCRARPHTKRHCTRQRQPTALHAPSTAMTVDGRVSFAKRRRGATVSTVAIRAHATGRGTIPKSSITIAGGWLVPTRRFVPTRRCRLVSTRRFVCCRLLLHMGRRRRVVLGVRLRCGSRSTPLRG